MSLDGMYGRTGVCPYTGECDSFRTIVNSERWMERSLSRLRRSGAFSLPEEEGGYTEESLLIRLEQMRRVKERCYGRNGRCLKFWQFERMNRDDRSLEKLRVRLEVMGSPLGPFASERAATKNEV